jgi:predicted MPP superfamily phosphohydrolase
MEDTAVTGHGTTLIPQARTVRDAAAALITSRPARVGVSILKAILPADRLVVTRRTIAVANLPPALAGLRLLHISDLHWHPGSELAQGLPALVARLAYDVAVYTGDFIDDDDGIAPVGAILGRMPRARASFAVMGNHDYLRYGSASSDAPRTQHNDVQRLRATLARRGITVLDNAAQPLFGSERLYITGVDDYTTGHADLAAALRAVPPGAATVLLSHHPDIVLRLGARRPGLILAGHTHGGQIRLPGVGAVVTHSALPRRHALGLTRYQDVPLFVTRGIGYSGLDLRVGCAPEVALLTLVPEHAAQRPHPSPLPWGPRLHRPAADPSADGGPHVAAS